jgi:outer membrane protein assembly factor BamD
LLIGNKNRKFTNNKNSRILKILGVSFPIESIIMYFCTMFFSRDHIILLIFIGLVVISGCGGYEKLLKSSDYAMKYQKALEYYEDEEYVRAGALLDQVANVYRGTTKADTVYYYQAKSYYMQRDYILSGHHFSNLAMNYPNSVYREEAEFMTAYCYYMQSPKPSLDQENTGKAISAFQLFMIQNPRSKRIPEAQAYIDEMRNKLVEKSYMSGKLYYNLGDYKASIIALQNSLNDFPETEHREELVFLLLKSNFLLAENSIVQKQMERYQATVDEYYSFVGEFPESKFRREADRIYDAALEKIGEPDMLSGE